MGNEKKKTAQVSMEYMMLFGFSLLIVGILWVNSSNDLQNSQWDLQAAYASNAVAEIVQAADIVYVQGVPSQLYAEVDLPDNTKAVYIENNSVTIELYWRGIPRNITEYSIANLTGSVSPAKGSHKILVSAGNPVSIQE